MENFAEVGGKKNGAEQLKSAEQLKDEAVTLLSRSIETLGFLMAQERAFGKVVETRSGRYGDVRSAEEAVNKAKEECSKLGLSEKDMESEFRMFFGPQI